ncbi:hypothetical protein E2320_022185 [Naja naja]|nr:hypothetical protein E2320_022185 [Naja naja]
MPRCTWKSLFLNHIAQIWPSEGDSLILTLAPRIKQGASSDIKQKCPEVHEPTTGPLGTAKTLAVQSRGGTPPGGTEQAGDDTGPWGQPGAQPLSEFQGLVQTKNTRKSPPGS